VADPVRCLDMAYVCFRAFEWIATLEHWEIPLTNLWLFRKSDAGNMVWPSNRLCLGSWAPSIRRHSPFCSHLACAVCYSCRKATLPIADVWTLWPACHRASCCPMLQPQLLNLPHLQVVSPGCLPNGPDSSRPSPQVGWALLLLCDCTTNLSLSHWFYDCAHFYDSDKVNKP
jgi:hypothetical protein